MQAAVRIDISTARVERAIPRRFANASQDVFADLFARYYERLVGYFMKRTHDKELSEDLAQDTILRLALAADRLDGSRPVWPYLRAMASNVFVDHLRRASREQIVDTEVEYAETPMPGPTLEERVSEQVTLDSVIERLPQRQQVAVDLRYRRGWSVVDAADFLGMTSGSLGQLLFRARQGIRTMVDEGDSRVAGLALPLFAGLRIRLRAALSRARDVVLTPGATVTMDSLVTAMVAATLGVSMLMTVAEVPRVGVVSAAGMVPLADLADRPADRGASASAPDVTDDRVPTTSPQATGEVPPTAPSPLGFKAEAQGADIAPVSAADQLSAGEEGDYFVVSNEIQAHVGVTLTDEGDDVTIDCNGAFGVVCELDD